MHETAATAAIWDSLVDAIGPDARTIALDRRGWGASDAPDQYVATTIEEQAVDADAVLREAEATPAVVCGAGLGAVVALELLLRHREAARAAVLVEPTMLSLLPEATEGIAGDREAITQAIGGGGAEAAVDLYLGGGLAFLGAGAERIPDGIGASARERAFSLFAELGAVPAWSLRMGEMLALETPSRLVIGGSTPPVLRSAAEQLSMRLGATELADLGGEGLPHLGAARRLADTIRELL